MELKNVFNSQRPAQKKQKFDKNIDLNFNHASSNIFVWYSKKGDLRMITDDIIIVDFADQEIRGDGSEGSEGSFDTEWRDNDDWGD